MAKALLIVDDEPMIHDIVSHRLEKFFDVSYRAVDGLQALEMMALHHDEIQLVVCDIKMPRMTGIEFIKEVRKRGHQQPFIFFTAFASRQIINEVSQLGVCGFFEKTQMDGIEEAVMAGISEQIDVLDVEMELARLGLEGE
ncbi:MAG: response regulator transcription factor [Bacteriovoracia bacterium]